MFKILVASREGYDHLEDLNVDIRLLLQKQSFGVWIEFMLLRIRTHGGLL